MEIHKWVSFGIIFTPGDLTNHWAGKAIKVLLTPKFPTCISPGYVRSRSVKIATTMTADLLVRYLTGITSRWVTTAIAAAIAGIGDLFLNAILSAKRS